MFIFLNVLSLNSSLFLIFNAVIQGIDALDLFLRQGQS